MLIATVLDLQAQTAETQLEGAALQLDTGVELDALTANTQLAGATLELDISPGALGEEIKHPGLLSLTPKRSVEHHYPNRGFDRLRVRRQLRHFND